MLVLGVIGKFGAVFTTIPDPVIGMLRYLHFICSEVEEINICCYLLNPNTEECTKVIKNEPIFSRRSGDIFKI